MSKGNQSIFVTVTQLVIRAITLQAPKPCEESYLPLLLVFPIKSRSIAISAKRAHPKQHLLKLGQQTKNIKDKNKKQKRFPNLFHLCHIHASPFSYRTHCL